MTLALALGMPVGHMLRSMTAREYAEWRAFYRREPFGGWRDDYRTGVIAATVVNAQRASSTSPIARPDQFMPRFWDSEEALREKEEEKKRAEVQSLRAMIRGAGMEAEYTRTGTVKMKAKVKHG